MFERFTSEARDVVVAAQEEARGLGHAWIGAEHLVLAILGRPAAAEAAGLASLGLTHTGWQGAIIAARELEPGLGTPDEVALQTLGIDLGEVRRRIEEGFGPGALDAGAPLTPARPKLPWRRPKPGIGTESGAPAPAGHIPFSPQAKKGLERSLREALALGDKTIGVEHLLLGILASKSGPVVDLLASLSLAPEQVRETVLAARGKAA